MVALVLRIKTPSVWMLWLLVLLLLGWSAHIRAEAEQFLRLSSQLDSLTSHGRSLIEEDLLPPEPPREVPALSSESPSPGPQPPKPPIPEAESQTVGVDPALPVPVSLSPQDVVALRFVEKGKGLLEQEHFDQAREQFEKAVAVAPLQPYSYYFLGRVALARREHTQALGFLQKAELLLRPNEQAWLGEATCLQGVIYEDRGDYAQARLAYQRCLQFVPQNLSALSALARLPAEDPLPNELFPR